MPDTRGDVLCPTCGQWTPPAPFCTECGAALQLGVQEPGQASAFRRGHEVDEPGSPWSSQAERFEPEPEDEAARAAAAGAAATGPRIDHLTEPEPPAVPPWPDEPGLAAPAGAAAAAAAAAGEPAEPLAEQPPAAPKKKTGKKAAEAAAAAAVVGAAAGSAAPIASDAPTAEQSIVPPIRLEPTPVEPPPAGPPAAMPPPPAAPPPVTYAGPPRDGDDSNGGVSGLVFVVFLGIGVLALLGGAMLGGVFDGPTADASPTPSEVVSTPSPEATPVPTPTASAAASLAPSPSPIATPPPAADGFIARAEPCEEQPSDSTCDSSGSVNDGNVWILVSFRHAQPSDTIGVEVMNSSGTVVDQGSIGLNFCGTNTDCAGYTYFQFGGLEPGNYDVEATRNGEPAAITQFRVE